MANRRCLPELTRRATALLFANQRRFISSLPTISQHLLIPISFKSITLYPTRIPNLESTWSLRTRLFSSNTDDVEEDEDEMSSEGEEVDDTAPIDLKRDYSPEEKAAEAAEIGYKVLGQLRLSNQRVFKPYEPVFAIVQVGSHQFKVSNGDSIYTERLKFCEVNDKLILNKVLLLGSRTQTIAGRPNVPDAAVHAVVEEHALDAKVLIFKKKRRKNYRRTKGHRQELTKLRITDIQGIGKPEQKIIPKPLQAPAAEPEKAGVAA